MTELNYDIIRASGILAWALVAAAVVWGLTIKTHLLAKRVRSIWLIDLHRFLGGTAVVFTFIHIVSTLVDTYTEFSLVNVLVPFTGTWHPVAVAWGIIGFYLMVAVETTSLLRKRIPRKVWRATHYSTFGVFAFSTVHLLTAGSDAQSPYLWWTVVAVAGVVGALIAERIGRSRTSHQRDRIRLGLSTTEA